MNTIIDPYTLGATLFVPLNHNDLSAILVRQKLPTLRSIVIDSEDGLSASALEHSLENFKFLLQTLIKNDLIIFFRVRNIKLLETVLEYAFIEKIDGFILPKFSLSNAEQYLDIFRFNSSFNFMPSIEGAELFDFYKLNELKSLLLPFKTQIILIRFGAQDMFSQLSLKRACEDTLYALSSSSLVIGNLVSIFKSSGFDISAAVYPCYKNLDVLKTECNLDVKNGLVSKTTIHPSQIPVIEKSYKITENEYSSALQILESDDLISSNNGSMLEPHTDLNWANNIIKRHKIYGLKV